MKRFVFKCDSTSLDFIGTHKARKQSDPVDLLVAPADAALWFQESGIVDELLDFDLDTVVALRSAIGEIVDAHLDGSEFSSDALATVNAFAAAPDPIPQLTATGRVISATASQAMSAVARDAIAVLTGDAVIKECSRNGCNQVFVDRSRGGRREWCAMDPCGNMIKAREYRARKAAAVA